MSDFGVLSKYEPHRNHARKTEAVLVEERLGFGAEPVRQQGDSAEVLIAGKLNRVLQEAASVTDTAVLGVNNQVFHDDHKTALGGADGEEQIDHGHDGVVGAQHEDAAPVGLFEDEPQTMLLLPRIGREVFLLIEQGLEQLNELGHVFEGGSFDAEIGGRLTHWKES